MKKVMRSASCPPGRPYALIGDNGEIIGCYVTKQAAEAAVEPRPSTRLRKLQLSKVDLVDRGADEHARVAIWKRAPDIPVADDKEAAMPLSKTELEALPEAVRKHIDALEGTAADAANALAEAERKLVEATTPTTEETADEDITKRDDIDPRVLEAITKRDEEIVELRKRAEQAEVIAKAEQLSRRKRETRERIAKADLSAEESDALVDDIIELEDAGKDELAKRLIEKMDALAEQSRTAALFEELGNPSPTAGSAEDKIEEIAKSYRENDPGLTHAQAVAKAVETNPDLFRQTLTEA